MTIIIRHITIANEKNIIDYDLKSSINFNGNILTTTGRTTLTGFFKKILVHNTYESAPHPNSKR
jgi:hypothetical protein